MKNEFANQVQQRSFSGGRIAILSDVHGNRLTLEAVLADIEVQGGVDETWILGDLAALGPEPVAVLERMTLLNNVRFVRGNTDRYLMNGDRPYPSEADVLEDPTLLPRFKQVTDSFSWTQGAITVHGWLPFFDDLPLEQRLDLPDGTRLLGVHAAPGLDDGSGLHPDLSDADWQAALDGCQADLVCVGHTHWPLNLHKHGVHIINLGSVSNPRIPSLQASYVLLTADTSGYQIRHRRVDYDRQAVVRQLESLRHPGRDFIVRFMRGDFQPPWDEPDLYEN